jgi:hypothetical protein
MDFKTPIYYDDQRETGDKSSLSDYVFFWVMLNKRRILLIGSLKFSKDIYQLKTAIVLVFKHENKIIIHR